MASRLKRIKTKRSGKKQDRTQLSTADVPTPHGGEARPGTFLLTVGPAHCECPICAVTGPPEYDEKGWSIREVTPEMETELEAAYARAAEMSSMLDWESSPFAQAGREAAELNLSDEELDQHFLEFAERINGEPWTGPTPGELLGLGRKRIVRA